MSARSLQAAQVSDWEEKAVSGGFSKTSQATEAAIQIRERGDAALSGVRSNRENLNASLARGSERWQASKDKERDEYEEVNGKRVNNFGAGTPGHRPRHGRQADRLRRVDHPKRQPGRSLRR